MLQSLAIWFNLGGPLMWVILAVLAVALAVAIERSIYYFFICLSASGDLLFAIVLAVTVSLSVSIGIFMSSIPSVRHTAPSPVHTIRTGFRITEPKRRTEPPVPTIKTPKPVPPVDLTEKPVETVPSVSPPAEPSPERQPARAVFGLRRVYSTGLGSEESNFGAVVGKTATPSTRSTTP